MSKDNSEDLRLYAEMHRFLLNKLVELAQVVS